MSALPQNQLFDAFRNYARLTRPYRKQMIVSATFINLMQILAVAEPIVMASMIQDVVQHHANVERLISLKAAGTLGLLLFLSIIQRWKAIYVRNFIEVATKKLYHDLFRKLLSLSGSFHETHNTTELHSRITKGITRMGDITFLLANELAPLVVMFVATSIATSYYSGASTKVIVPVVLVFVIATIKVRAMMASQRRLRHRIDREADQQFGAAILNIRTVWAFGREEDELAKFSEMQERMHQLLLSEYRAYDALDLGRNTLVGGGKTAVLLICLYQALHDPSMLPQLFLVVSLAARLFQSCYNIGSVYDRFIESSEPIAQMVTVIEEPITITDPTDPMVIDKVQGEIHFQDACYAYDSNPNKLALDHLTFTIQPGEKIGIVGESGGGKSTLTKALLRFIDLTSGSILIDGINIRRLTRAQLRQSIGYVAQDIEIFDGTIAENIGYGKKGATQDEIVAAAKKAHAHEFILSLPDGYATRVGDRGLRLSGGQRQRIGVARVFLKDAPIILFDEATSNVDAGSDAAIHESVADLVASGKTVIVIAHRLATVQNADRLIYIQDGRMVETGTPKELEKKGGYYANLLRKHDTLGKRETVSGPN